MISPVLKDFIEHNSNLLETDLRAFLGKALVRLRGTVFEELISMLTEAGVDFDVERTRMILNKLGFIFPVVEDETPLTDVIKDHLLSRGTKTFFGLTVHELVDLIQENEDIFKHDMYTETINGIVIVRTKLL